MDNPNAPLTPHGEKLLASAPLMLAGLKYLRVYLEQQDPTKENKVMLGTVSWIIHKAEGPSDDPGTH